MKRAGNVIFLRDLIYTRCEEIYFHKVLCRIHGCSIKLRQRLREKSSTKLSVRIRCVFPCDEFLSSCWKEFDFIARLCRTKSHTMWWHVCSALSPTSFLFTLENFTHFASFPCWLIKYWKSSRKWISRLCFGRQMCSAMYNLLDFSACRGGMKRREIIPNRYGDR